MNDFAGPIIQAFMQGQQMKRQTQQDVIAAQEREKEAKRYMDSLKRMEQQDKLQLSLGRFQIEDMLRKQVGSGDRKIPVEAMQAPGGMQAPQMGPIAQQLMGPSAVQEMPLQEMPGQTQTMQLGQEFALPETNRVQKPIINIPGYGDFDLSQFRGEEETMRRNLMLARQAMGLEGEKTKITEGIKSGFRIAEQAPKDTAAMNRVLTQVGGTAANLDKTLKQNENQSVRRDAQFEKTYALDQEKAAETARNNRAKIDLASRKLELASGGSAEDKVHVTSLLKQVENGTLTEEELAKLGAKTNMKVREAALSAGLPIYNTKQLDGKTQFKVLADAYRLSSQLGDAYAKSKILGISIAGSRVKELRSQMDSKMEIIARDVQQAKGVLAVDDLQRAYGSVAGSFLEGGSKQANAERLGGLGKTIIDMFDTKYPKTQFSPKQRAQLLSELGLLDINKSVGGK